MKTKTFQNLRLRYLRLLLLTSLCLFVSANLTFWAFELVGRSIYVADSISFVTFLLSILDFWWGHLECNFYKLVWYHLVSTLVPACYSLWALVWWIKEDKDKPVGWWTNPPEFVINKAIWVFLCLQCLLLASKLVILLLEVLFQTCYLRHRGVLSGSIVHLYCENPTMAATLWALISVLPSYIGAMAAPLRAFISILLSGIAARLPNGRDPPIGSPISTSPRSQSPSGPHDDSEPRLFHERRVESPLLSRVRSVVVIIVCLGLFSYGFALMTIIALRETVIMPTQNALARIDDPLWGDPVAPVWSVIVAIDEISLAPDVDLGSAVTVTPLWDSAFLLPLLTDNQTLPQWCENISEGTDPFTLHTPSLGTRYATFLCPDAFRRSISLSEWITTDIRIITPDLLVSIDYNKLNIPLDDHLSILHTAFVSVGLTNKTDVVLRSTFPHPLVSRVHTLASIYLEVRRIYRTIKILSMGIFPPYDNFFVAQLNVIGPDPFATVASNDNTASMRLFQHYDPSDWVIVQDRREYSILNVFSSLGGMWTVANGIFALIFGGSMLTVFGVKPVSIFGFAHRIYGAGARLHDAFPLLKEEAFPAEEESKGMSAFLAEYGLDLSSLEEVDGGGPTGGSHVPSAGEAASSQELDSLGGVDGHGATGGSHAGLGAYVPLLHQEPGQHGST